MKKYDYYLIVITAFILFAIGLVCVYGIAYYNYLAINTEWTRTLQYTYYINDMNSYLYPFLVLLLVSLGMCVPKRLLEMDLLLRFGALALGATIFLTVSFDIETGFGFILAVTLGMQGFIVLLTLGRSSSIRYEKEGYVARLGSALLHLGVVLLIFNFVALKESSIHLPVFWGGMALLTAGNIFSFYPEKISSLIFIQ